MTRRIHDITMPLRNGLPGWPGDAAYAFRLNWTQVAGASVNVGALEMSVHSGTHADAPFHVDPNGQTIDRVALDVFIGPAIVLDVARIDVGIPITMAVLHRAADVLGGSLSALLARVPRLLLRTGSWSDRTVFPGRIAVLAPEAAAALAEAGVRLLGVDVPSVDALDSKTLPVHHALNAGGVTIVENLQLDAVGPGEYDLIALPLPIVGGDGSPLRAVLIGRC